MYQIPVPVHNDNLVGENRERTLQELKRLDATRVILSLGTYKKDEKKKQAELELLRDNCAFFHRAGYEVAAWIWTFWVVEDDRFRFMRSIEGKDSQAFVCPTDEKFVEYASDYIKEIAATGVDMIQFDDDFRYGSVEGQTCCLCDGHIAAINRITGRKDDRETIYRHIVSGGPNPLRDAWLQVNGDSFRNFAKAVRKKVDEVNPAIRIGPCACLTSWDLDGITAGELAKTLAGNTKPFARLIGAPYWAARRSWGTRLPDVIELERMEAAWTRQSGEIELFAEGDTYPRPRSSCPASYLEGYDMALRAAGCLDGIQKYALDYVSKADYERGYADLYQRNKPMYAKIQELFGDKTSVGVRIYEAPEKVRDMVMPTKVNKTMDLNLTLFSKAGRSFANNTVPTVYEGEGICGVVFDESARTLPLKKIGKGLILDIAAAEILQERGVDVGLASIGDSASGDALRGSPEVFVKEDNRILTGDTAYCDITLKEGAELMSYAPAGERKVPVTYRYENAQGQRFLVLNLLTRPRDVYSLKHYARARQYAEQVEWISGQKLPAFVYGHPALYIQCKEKEGALAVGLWNFFEDIAFAPVVELGKEYREIRFISGAGRLEGDRVYLEDMPIMGFTAFEVK